MELGDFDKTAFIEIRLGQRAGYLEMVKGCKMLHQY